jgi:hypothetical protein
MRHPFVALGLGFAVSVSSALPAFAQTPSPSPAPSAAVAPGAPGGGMSDDAVLSDAAKTSLAKQRLTEMLKTGQADEAWFTPYFISQIPISDVNSLLAQILTDVGPFKSIAADGPAGTFKATFAKGTDVIVIKLSNKLIDYLLFKPLK